MKRILCSCLGLSLLAWSIWAVAVAQEPVKSSKKDAGSPKKDAGSSKKVADSSKKDADAEPNTQPK